MRVILPVCGMIGVNRLSATKMLSVLYNGTISFVAERNGIRKNDYRSDIEVLKSIVSSIEWSNRFYNAINS